MKIKNIQTNTISEFLEIFPYTSNPNSVWLLEQGYEFYTPEPVVYIPTEQDIINNLVNAVTNHLNEKAFEKNYDNIQSAALRAGYPGPFHDEGVIYATWMDACWSYCYQVLADCKASLRTVPSPEELVLELPTITL